MSVVTELGYVVFGVKDLERWKAFGTDFLGLEAVEGETADRCYLRMDFWHHRYVLERDPVDDVLGLGFRVAGAEEFDQMMSKLTSNGVPFRLCSADEADQRRVLQLMKLEDALGNPLEIFHGPLVEHNKPFHSGRRMFGSFLTGSGGLGHCMMHGNDIVSAQRFYAMLGMRGGVEYRLDQPDGTRVELLFMHCNDRDHSIAFGFPGKKRMNHIMVESDDVNDVIYTYELAREMKIPIAVDLGRHSNDHELSFYMMSPSGFLMEYGWGSRNASHQSEYYTADFYGHNYQSDVVNSEWNTVE